jgi:hypothetical protein
MHSIDAPAGAKGKYAAACQRSEWATGIDALTTRWTSFLIAFHQCANTVIQKNVGRMPVLLLKKRLFGDFSSISLHRWFFLCFPVSQHFTDDDGIGEVAVFKVHIGEELIVKG